jgi:hypothetical protein
MLEFVFEKKVFVFFFYYIICNLFFQKKKNYMYKLFNLFKNKDYIKILLNFINKK